MSVRLCQSFTKADGWKKCDTIAYGLLRQSSRCATIQVSDFSFKYDNKMSTTWEFAGKFS